MKNILAPSIWNDRLYSPFILIFVWTFFFWVAIE